MSAATNCVRSDSAVCRPLFQADLKRKRVYTLAEYSAMKRQRLPSVGDGDFVGDGECNKLVDGCNRDDMKDEKDSLFDGDSDGSLFGDDVVAAKDAKDSVFDEDSDGSLFGDDKEVTNDAEASVFDENSDGSLFGDNEEIADNEKANLLDKNPNGSLSGNNEAVVIDLTSEAVDAKDVEEEASDDDESSDDDEASTDSEDEQDATGAEQPTPVPETGAEKLARIHAKVAARRALWEESPAGKAAAEKAAAARAAAETAARERAAREKAAYELFPASTDPRVLVGRVRVNAIVEQCVYSRELIDGQHIGKMIDKSAHTFVIGTFHSPLEGIYGTTLQRAREAMRRQYHIQERARFGLYKDIEPSSKEEFVMDIKFRMYGREVRADEERWLECMNLLMLGRKQGVFADMVARVAKVPVDPFPNSKLPRGKAFKRVQAT